MTFEDVLDQHKEELTEALILFGEGKRLNKILAEDRPKRPEYYLFYQAGKDSKQKEFDELKQMYDIAIECLMESNYGDEKYLKVRGAIK